MEVFDIVCELIIPILIFVVLVAAGKLIYKRLSDSENRLLNPGEYFPEQEIETLKQVYYLIMMLIFFNFILYIWVVEGNDVIAILILQIIISVYVALTLDYSSRKNKILFFLLVPYESVILILFNRFLIIWPIYIIHTLVYAYFIKVYFDKFRKYTETNSLGITIILLFTLIFVSFIVTSIVEGVDPLSSLVMVSNAFTSNGYAILGKTGIGKLTALTLVWGGYIISGVGTATLTAAILLRNNNKREEELNKRFDKREEELNKRFDKREEELNKRLDELESLIKNNRE